MTDSKQWSREVIERAMEADVAPYKNHAGYTRPKWWHFWRWKELL